MFEKIDYWVSAASYSERNGTWLIEAALIHPNVGETHEYGEEWTREEIIDKCDVFVFCLICKDEKGNWKMGSQLRKVETEKGVFIRTDEMKKTGDYLGDIPFYDGLK